MKKHLLRGILSLTILVSATPSFAISKEVYEKLDIMAEVFERIRVSYVNEVTDTKLIEEAIDGMLSSLDPHSSYLDSENFQSMQEQTKGEFGGLGIEVTMENGVVKVVSPIDDTPAYRAGIEAGDYIIKIDDEDVQGMKLGDAVDRMRGKVGTKIVIKVFRESTKESFDVTIVRDVIQIKPLRSHIEDEGIGYVRITSFNEHTTDQLEEHLAELKKENDNKPLRGIVLDLRNNPGGLLNQAVSVADTFLDHGEIVSTKGRILSQNTRFNSQKGDMLDGAPMVILINGGSASASEIVAGALQDHKRAVIVGTKSFGKGSVQTIIPLRGDAGMRLTTALYYTPSGRSIQAEGIVPDVEIKRVKVEEIDSEHSTESSLRGHLDNGNDKEEKAKEEAKKKMNKKELKSAEDKEKSAKDYQLQRAIGIVKAMSLWAQR